jgi:hypothetical protein
MKQVRDLTQERSTADASQAVPIHKSHWPPPLANWLCYQITVKANGVEAETYEANGRGALHSFRDWREKPALKPDLLGVRVPRPVISRPPAMTSGGSGDDRG